jgi:hypothetical protein
VGRPLEVGCLRTFTRLEVAGLELGESGCSASAITRCSAGFFHSLLCTSGGGGVFLWAQ